MKHHTGKLSDSLDAGEEDAAREMARAQSQALAALKKPVEQKRGPRHDVGDGDPCPAVDEDGNSLNHGKMYVYGKRQYCPHSGHDGNGKRRAPTTRWFPLWMDKESAA